MSREGGIETETTLLVAGPDPRRVFAELASRREIAGHTLQPRGTRLLEDLYLDTPEGALRRREIALRLRRIGGEPPRRLLTVKGPARVHADGRMDRRELELPWSAAALEKALAALREMGAGLPGADVASFGEDPRATLGSLGLEAVQERANERQVLELRAEAKEETARACAEMDLDAVTFLLSSRRVRHFEIEIESRSEEGALALSAVSRALLEAHPDLLLVWPHSKTATGETLARLEDSGALGALLDTEGRPTPEGYRELRRLLRG